MQHRIQIHIELATLAFFLHKLLGIFFKKYNSMYVGRIVFVCADGILNVTQML